MSGLGPNLTSSGLDNDGNPIINVADPVNPQDAATRAFASNAGNLSSGAIPPAILGNSSLFIGTAEIPLNRASANIHLTGVTIDVVSAAATLTWDMSGYSDMGKITISAAQAFMSSNTNAILGGFTQATIIADGIHTPTFDGAPLTNWNNTNGAANLVRLENVGGYKYWSCGSSTGTLIS